MTEVNTNHNNQQDHNLKHLAIIMDGNARWADLNKKTKASGHKQGAETAGKITKKACEIGISYMTLYTFSSENWLRPSSEVTILMDLLRHYVRNEVDSIHKQGIKLKVIGNLTKLDKDLRNEISKAIKLTENNDKMTLALAISYGSREEITTACKRIALEALETDDATAHINKIDEKSIGKYLYDPEMPDVDLLVRTGGCQRISNFLLWQSAYAELYFIDKYWPDFDEEDLLDSVKVFSSRKRYFGKR